MQRQPSLTAVFLWALSGLTLSYFMLVKVDPNAGIPDRSRLTSASGVVSSCWTTRYDVQFKLQDGRQFSYSSRGRAQGTVKKAIAGAAGAVVTILYDASNPRRPVFSSATFFDVYEIRVGRELVRSYEDVDQARRRSNRLARPLGWGALALSVWLLVHGIRRLGLRTGPRA